jgi:hypothetical protein
MCNKKQCAAEALNAEAARCCRACPMMARKRHQEKLCREHATWPLFTRHIVIHRTLSYVALKFKLLRA